MQKNNKESLTCNRINIKQTANAQSYEVTECGAKRRGGDVGNQVVAQISAMGVERVGGKRVRRTNKDNEKQTNETYTRPLPPLRNASFGSHEGDGAKVSGTEEVVVVDVVDEVVREDAARAWSVSSGELMSTRQHALLLFLRLRLLLLRLLFPPHNALARSALSAGTTKNRT